MTIRKAAKNPAAAARELYHRLPKSATEIKNSYYYIKYRFTSQSYTEFYKNLQNRKIREGYAYDWDSDVGIAQFEFLKRNGLSPEDELLDIGCGNLRGGIHSIRYLQPSNYHGIDISEEAIKAGKEILREEELLNQKEPNLLVNNNLMFEELKDETFDYIFAQSVFTHLPKEEIAECFEHVSAIMNQESVFFASVHIGEENIAVPSLSIESSDDYSYTMETFRDLGTQYGLEVCQVAYPEHPLDMDMIKIELR